MPFMLKHIPKKVRQYHQEKITTHYKVTTFNGVK